jgi:hypothetical protein
MLRSNRMSHVLGLVTFRVCVPLMHQDSFRVGESHITESKPNAWSARISSGRRAQRQAISCHRSCPFRGTGGNPPVSKAPATKEVDVSPPRGAWGAPAV